MVKNKQKSDVIKISQTSGWVVVSSKTNKVVAHAKTFPKIVSVAEKYDSNTHVIMSAAPSYRYQLMITIKS